MANPNKHLLELILGEVGDGVLDAVDSLFCPALITDTNVDSPT